MKACEHPVYVDVIKYKRKRRLSAKEGVRGKQDHYRFDAETVKAMELAIKISHGVMGLKPATSVILRRAVRLYAEHLKALLKAREKEGVNFLDFLDALDAERTGLYQAACQEK